MWEEIIPKMLDENGFAFFIMFSIVASVLFTSVAVIYYKVKRWLKEYLKNRI